MNSKKLILIFTMVLSLTALKVFAETVVISDSNFLTADWTMDYWDSTTNLSSNDANICQIVLDGTNPVLSSVYDFDKAPDEDAYQFVYGTVYHGASYNPSTQGPINKILYSFKNERGSPGYSKFCWFMVAQDGSYYFHYVGGQRDNSADGTFTEFSSIAFEDDFQEEWVDGIFWPDPTFKPDFSASGSEMKFGILEYQAGGAGATSATFNNMFDDFVVTINPYLPVQVLGTIENMSDANAVPADIIFEDYVTDTDPGQGDVAKIPSPSTVFAAPDSNYSTLNPLPPPAAFLVHCNYGTRNWQVSSDLYFYDFSTDLEYCTLLRGTQEASQTSQLVFEFIDPNSPDLSNPTKATVSRVGFHVSSVNSGNVAIRFYDIDGNLMASEESFVQGKNVSRSYISKDNSEAEASLIHKVEIIPAEGSSNGDLWAFGNQFFSDAVDFSYYGLVLHPETDLDDDGDVDLEDLAIYVEDYLQY